MLETMLDEFKSCGVALLPLIVTFLLFQIFSLKLSMKKLVRILTSVLIVYVGLVILLTGLDWGYVPVGRSLGQKFSELPYKWIIVPLGFILGFIITQVEPSVHVLIGNVEQATHGTISKKLLLYTLSIGIGLSIALAMLKILINIPIWYILIPSYLIAFLLTISSSERFTAIAYDSGGVATGVMTTTFILSIALGLAEGISGANSAANGFGLIAIVAITPIIMILLLGKIYDMKRSVKGNDKK